MPPAIRQILNRFTPEAVQRYGCGLAVPALLDGLRVLTSAVAPGARLHICCRAWSVRTWFGGRYYDLEQ